MDKEPELDAVDEDRIAPRSGRDRRSPSDRRQSNNRLLELHARREGITDRRQRERREQEELEAGRARRIRRWFSFLRLPKWT